MNEVVVISIEMIYVVCSFKLKSPPPLQCNALLQQQVPFLSSGILAVWMPLHLEYETGCTNLLCCRYQDSRAHSSHNPRVDLTGKTNKKSRRTLGRV